MLEIKSTLDVIFNMADEAFDYQRFLSACSDNNVPPLDMAGFARFLGAVKAADFMFPDDGIAIAYERFIEAANTPVIQPVAANPVAVPVRGCGGCGGGQVR